VNKEILENIKTSLVVPYERNARKNDAAVKEVVKSIERTGYRTPIIIDENNVILCGHTRLKAIQKMGWKEIPFVIKYNDLTESQKQEYRIRDNKTGEIAEWDFEILEADFSMDELVELGFNQYKETDYEEKENNPIEYFIIKIEFDNEDDLRESYEKLNLMGYKCSILM